MILYNVVFVMSPNENIMLKTIGYAFSEQNNQDQLCPLLFFNEPELENLSWITTLFPKENQTLLAQQLTHFIDYYQNDPLLIIGGDLSLINIIDQHCKPHWISNNKTLCTTHPVSTNSKTVYCIDARYPLPDKIEKSNMITIIHYDYTKDIDKTIFQGIKSLLVQAIAP